MKLTLGRRSLATPRITKIAAALAAVTLLTSSAVLFGFGQQPGQFRARGNVEHGVLTLMGLDATFMTSDAKARRWQEIVKGAGHAVVEEYNRMSIVDILVNGGWEIVSYEFELDPTAGDVGRYLLKRTRP